MAVFVLGHGAYWEGDDTEGPTGKWTRVPSGMRMLFYARPDEGLLPMNALEVVRRNGAGGAIDTAEADKRIPNYCFSPLDDFEYRFMLSAVQDRQDVRFIGQDDLASVDRLCTSYGQCSVAGHSCSGLFGKLSNTEVHLLTCRIGPLEPGMSAADAARELVRGPVDDKDDPGKPFQNTYHLPGESPGNPAHFSAIKDVARRILDLAKPVQSGDGIAFKDVHNAEAGSLFDRQSREMQVKLMAVQEVQIWSYQRYARVTVNQFIQSGDWNGLAAWKSGLKAQELRWYSWDPFLNEKLGL